MVTQRIVLIVNIEQGSESRGLFKAMYGRLEQKLNNTPGLCISTVDSVETLQAKCATCKPKETVLLFTNETIAKKKDLHEMVCKFVSRGGLAIIGCLFSSFTTPPMTDALFNALGLPWKTSNYCRTTFGLTEVGKLLQLTNVPQRYSAKAVQLADVPAEQKLYKPVEDATTESMVFSTEPADTSLVLSAFGKIGEGAVAYVGDVNAEEGSDSLTVALCVATW